MARPKESQELHCIIKQQLEAIGVIYSWGLCTAVYLEIEADYLFAWPPITTQELVTSLASSISFYKQVQFNAVLRRKYITYQPQMELALAVKSCVREMYMHIERKVPSTTKVVCPSRDHQS